MLSFVALIGLSLCACTSSGPPTLTRLPNYEEANRLQDVAAAQPAPASPRLLVHQVNRPQVLDELVPYAQVARIVIRNHRSDENLRECALLLADTRPDALYYAEGDAAIERGAGLYHDSELSPRHTKYRVPTLTLALRCAPATLPLRFRPQNGVVTHILIAEACGGLREGDTLLSIDGYELPVPESAWLRSPFQRQRLIRKPGEKVPASWMRAGVGRMDGEIELSPNPRSYLTEPDGLSVDLKDDRRSTNNDGQ